MAGSTAGKRQDEQQQQYKGGVLEDKVQADVEYKSFWENPERFADLFNGVCFQGSNVIHAEALQDADVEASGIIEYVTTRESLVRTRDVIKKTAYGMKFLIMAIENQETIDYTMPLRVMVYDGQNYLKELKKQKEIAHQKAEPSNRRGGYQISPVITIVMYYGKTPWNGPLCLIDMMGEVSSEIRDIVSDYKMHLVEVLRSDAGRFHNRDVKQVMEYAQAFMNKDMEQVKRLSLEETTTLEVAYMVGKITKSQQVIMQVVKNHQLESKGEVDMCEFITELIEDGEKRGEKRGILGAIDLMRQLECVDEIIESKLIETYQISQGKARKYMSMK